ncbi:hypothetical protein [uncultured Dokdonia sp.]|uniref:hypothetical protein n=1 Tax=uncultured Dokdonia sp. TaxID=575653 RepID=UPI002607CDCB|nr:hypothetical protein [uncultured Dokdonia sp.]
MRLYLYFLLILLCFACQKKEVRQVKPVKLKGNSLKKQIKKVETSKEAAVFDTLHVFPKDTIVNQWNFHFKQIGVSLYKSLKSKTITTNFEQDDTRNFLTKKDSCFYLNIHTRKKDTLCSFNDGEYYENYIFKGFSKKTNTVLFDWNNWEEAHSLLINLNQDRYWILCPEYEVSPNNRRLITFSNYIDHPIYEKNEFFIYELEEHYVTPIYYFSNQIYGIFETLWVDQNTALIQVKKIDDENYKTTTSYFFELKMTKPI